MAKKKSAAFPVGLYGMMLFALAWLTLPQVFAPLERWLVGSACLLPRAASAWFGVPAMAADPAALESVAALRTDLLDRVEQHDFDDPTGVMPAGYARELCRVVSVGRAGGGGVPSELLLGRSYRELAGHSRLVTKAGALLGFVMERGKGRALDDLPDDPARVMLLNHHDAPRLFASLVTPEQHRLRFVLRAAGTVDPAPLRVDMWDNPYQAAGLSAPRLPVHTEPLDGSDVPGGLLIGRTRIWGYRGAEQGETLTIGVYVTPAVDSAALSHVVLWRTADGAVAGGVGEPVRAAGTVYELPGASRGRHLLVCGREVPDGAAVTQNGLFLGTARGISFGNALVTSFLASRHQWSLLFLPDEDGADPVELRARVEWDDRHTGVLRWQGPAQGEQPLRSAGDLFTGSNGTHCPAGLWIGRAEADPFRPRHLKVTVPALRGPQRAQVVVGEESSE